MKYFDDVEREMKMDFKYSLIEIFYLFQFITSALSLEIREKCINVNNNINVKKQRIFLSKFSKMK